MNNQIFALGSYEWKTFLYAIGVLVLVLTLLHLIGNKFRLKRKTKKDTKKLEKNYNEDSTPVKKIILLINTSKKYTGKFKSFRGSEKKKLKKFLLEWLKKVPSYVELNHKVNEKKTVKLYVATTKDPYLKKLDLQWVYKAYSENIKKNAKKNYKKLVKFMNKTKCAKGIIDVICHIFDEDKNFKNLEERYFAQENHIYVTYYAKKRKQ